MTKPKSKRVNLTVPMEWYEPLERWATLQTRDPGNLALAIIVDRLREALANGEIPEEEEENQAIAKVMQSCWLKVARGEKLTCGEIIQLAGLLDIDPEKFKQTLDESGLKHEHHTS